MQVAILVPAETERFQQILLFAHDLVGDKTADANHLVTVVAVSD